MTAASFVASVASCVWLLVSHGRARRAKRAAASARARAAEATRALEEARATLAAREADVAALRAQAREMRARAQANEDAVRRAQARSSDMESWRKELETLRKEAERMQGTIQRVRSRSPMGRTRAARATGSTNKENSMPAAHTLDARAPRFDPLSESSNTAAPARTSGIGRGARGSTKRSPAKKRTTPQSSSRSDGQSQQQLYAVGSPSSLQSSGTPAPMVTPPTSEARVDAGTPVATPPVPNVH